MFVLMAYVSVGRPDIFRNNTISNPKATKIDISRLLLDLHAQKWNSTKGKQ